MKLLPVLATVLVLAGCATPRLYGGEPVDKSNAVFLRAVYIKALIKPPKSDDSVQLRITDDGTWVSSGSFLVKYACLDSRQDPKDVHEYPNQQIIHVEAGYHYNVECSDDKAKLVLSNSAWEDFDYQSFGEVLSVVPDEIRHLDTEPAGAGFRYLYFNDYGGSGETNFEIYVDDQSKLLTAQLTQYRDSVMDLAADAYNRGVRTRDAMTKALAAEKHSATIAACPKLQDLYSKIQIEFDARFNQQPKPTNGLDRIYTDSPPIYRYYMGKNKDGTESLALLDEQGPLYRATMDAMDYVKSCGKSE